MDGVKGALEAPAVAQKLVKPPEGNARQGQGFAGSTKFWQIADFCLTAKGCEALVDEALRVREEGIALSHLPNLLVVA